MNEDLEKCLQVLGQGGLILYPTDTVWGLGCDAADEQAIRKIYRLKGRSDSKSLILLVADFGDIRDFVSRVPPQAEDYLQSNERPTTVIFDGARNLPACLISPDGSIALRVTREIFSASLVREFGSPVVSTSANISGLPAPAYFDRIDPGIRMGVDYVVSFRQEEQTPCLPSRIVRWDAFGNLQLIRP